MSVPIPPEAPAKSPQLSTQRPLVAIGLILAAFTIIPVMDAIAKALSNHIPVLQLVWARYFFHLLIFLPITAWRHGAELFRPARPRLQLARGAMLMASTALFFAAIARMPLADTIAIVFVYPFIVTLLSGLVLGERAGPWRYGAVAVGFIGTLVIIRPGLGTMSPGMPYALAAGCIYAGYILSTRKLAGSAAPLVTLTFTGLVGAVLATLAMPFVWVQPAIDDWPWLFALGLIAAVGHLLIIMAHERARASQLAPFGYFEIVAATLLGLFVFGEFPDFVTWIGIAIVVASGLVIWWREARA